MLNSGILCAQKDTVQLISSWTVSDDYLHKFPTKIDTSLEFFHQYNPIFKWSYGNAFLGNIGSPVISELFFLRNTDNDFIFLNLYYPYLETVGKTNYINTHKQFTTAKYITGGTSSTKEEMLDVFHTQNINPRLNFGIKFITNGSVGQYQFQHTRRNSFKFFSSYEGKKFDTYFNLNTNNFSTDENGGIVNDSMLNSTDYNSPSNIPTVFEGSADKSNVRNTFKNFSFELANNVNLLKLFARKDTSSVDSSGYKLRRLGLIHVIGMETNKRMFEDAKPSVGQSAGFYDTTFFNSNSTFDSINYRKFYNSIRLYFLPVKNTFWSFALINEWYRYSLFSQDNKTRISYSLADGSSSPFTYIHNESDIKINSTLGISSDLLYLNFTGSYYLAGYKKRGYNLGSEIRIGSNKGDRSFILANASLTSNQPLFLQNAFYSNSFIWNNSFKPAKILNLSLKYSNSPNKFEPELNYSVLSNLIYFNDQAIPQQYNHSIQVFAASIYKRFDFWKISSLNKIALQHVSNSQILSLPNIVFYNSTFLKQRIYFKLTKGELFTALGFNMYYNTKYFAPAYMPALGEFHTQSEKKIGNYPIVDIFLNVRLKRARFFFKFEHVNAGLTEKNYFSVLHYPMNDRMFKMGLSWNFYD